MKLNPEQFAAHVAEHGGATVSPKTGTSPQSGYVTSDWGSEETHEGLPTADHVRSFLKTHQDALKARGAHLGGWVQDGTTFLDVSRRYPNARAGMAAGRRNAQYGVYDIDHDRAIDPYGGGIKYRGTLFEHMSRNERRRVSRSNSQVARQRDRETLERAAPKQEHHQDRNLQQMQFEGM